MTNRLTVKRLVSIGAVPDGDNPESEIVLFKSATVTGRNTDSVEDTRDTDMSDLDLSAVADDLRAEIEKTIGDLTARVAELETPADEDITKGMSDEVKAEFARLEKAAADNAEALAKERDERLTVVWTGKAQAFTKILGDPADAAPFLKGMEAETSEWLLDKLATVEKVLEKADLFKEIGSSEDDATPADKIAAIAKDKQKDNPELTPAQARALARSENPDLVEAERGL